MHPQISVITINYNNADGLKDTLESIAAQTSDAFETIVVDGHSRDESLKIIEDMSDLVTFWVSEPDGGIYDAMNKGVGLARGGHVVFMNSGDSFFDHQVVARVADILARDTPDLLHGRVRAMESGKPYQYNPHLWQGMICSHQATFARRDLLQRFPFSADLKIVADYNFYVQCDRAGARFLPVDLDIALIDTSGVSFANFQQRTEERMRVCARAYPRPDVYAHFKGLFQNAGLAMPDWAQSEEAWLNGPA